MSDFHCSISVYDVLTDVVYVVRVYDLDQPAGPNRLALEVVSAYPGRGLSDSHRWLLSVLATITEAVAGQLELKELP
jgi:hypothetical protein